jgi:hypothetical protein
MTQRASVEYVGDRRGRCAEEAPLFDLRLLVLD